MRAVSSFLVACLALGCVPNDPPPEKSPEKSATRAERSPVRPAASSRRPNLAELRKRSPSAAPSAGADDDTPAAPDPRLTKPFVDNFERAALGDDWAATSPRWRIESGQLCVRGARNHPAWLRRRLPTNARIEFDAVSKSPDGDIKAELWGDGRSAARGVTYDHATSYLTIFGGWKNQFHVLARIDEHAKDRPEIRLDPENDEPRARTVVENQLYHFKVERDDGRTVRWYVDDIEILTFADPDPLEGPGHEHFAFNDWDVPVCFDNLTVTPLP